MHRAIIFVALALAGCGSDSKEGAAAQRGALIYMDPLPTGNSFACATCHALSEPAPDFRRPGHPIGDAAARGSWKNGTVGELRGAVNTCAVEWMNAGAFAADDPTWLDLEAFLGARAPESAAPLRFEIVQPPDDPTGGDSNAGRDFFNGACAVCHGADASGTQRAPSLGQTPLEPEYVARRVRRSGRADSTAYPGLTGGIMPFWSADRLSDAELRDVVAFVAALSRGDIASDANAGADSTTNQPRRQCESTHPRVGQVAALVERFHGVGGTVRVIDDCTLLLEGFTYDATGIEVRLYGGLEGNYTLGPSLSDDLVRGTPYAGEELYVTLPEGTTLDDFDGVSVWCVAVGVSFGDGRFADEG